MTTIGKWAKNGEKNEINMLFICFCIGEHLNKMGFYNNVNCLISPPQKNPGLI